MLLGDVGFGAMGCNANRPCSRFIGLAQVFHRTDTRKQKGGELGVLQDAGGRFDVIEIGFLGEAVIEGHPGKPVAVGHFDRVDLGFVEGLADCLDVIEAVLVADGVHPVPQGDVLDVDLLFFVDCHNPVLQAVAMRRSMTRSAVRMAADVMMSRLPAYFGR